MDDSIATVWRVNNHTQKTSSDPYEISNNSKTTSSEENYSWPGTRTRHQACKEHLHIQGIASKHSQLKPVRLSGLERRPKRPSGLTEMQCTDMEDNNTDNANKSGACHRRRQGIAKDQSGAAFPSKCLRSNNNSAFVATGIVKIGSQRSTQPLSQKLRNGKSVRSKQNSSGQADECGSSSGASSLSNLSGRGSHFHKSVENRGKNLITYEDPWLNLNLNRIHKSTSHTLEAPEYEVSSQSEIEVGKCPVTRPMNALRSSCKRKPSLASSQGNLPSHASTPFTVNHHRFNANSSSHKKQTDLHVFNSSEAPSTSRSLGQSNMARSQNALQECFQRERAISEPFSSMSEVRSSYSCGDQVLEQPFSRPLERIGFSSQHGSFSSRRMLASHISSDVNTDPSTYQHFLSHIPVAREGRNVRSRENTHSVSVSKNRKPFAREYGGHNNLVIGDRSSHRQEIGVRNRTSFRLSGSSSQESRRGRRSMNSSLNTDSSGTVPASCVLPVSQSEWLNHNGNFEQSSEGSFEFSLEDNPSTTQDVLFSELVVGQSSSSPRSLGSSSSGGRNHGISQSPIGNHMHAFEDREGFVEFERRRYRVMAEGLAEILLTLERVERNEDLSQEQLMMLEATLLFGGMGLHDQHSAWRLDVDNMSYEELLALGEQIGTVCTGLNEDTICQGLKIVKYVKMDGAFLPRDNESKCCICQEDYMDGEYLGKIDCGHSYHTDCIKQWLVRKNQCAICKLTAISPS